MNTYTVSFFEYRMIDDTLEVENRLERLIRTLLREHEYVEFLLGTLASTASSRTMIKLTC